MSVVKYRRRSDDMNDERLRSTRLLSDLETGTNVLTKYFPIRADYFAVLPLIYKDMSVSSL